MLFLTMHGIDRDHRVGQRKRAEQTLDRRNFIGLFVAVEMRQHQSRVGSEGAEYVRGAAVKKVVEASPQGLAINRHVTLTFAVRRVVQHGGMAAECSFDRGGIVVEDILPVAVGAGDGEQGAQADRATWPCLSRSEHDGSRVPKTL